MFRRVLAFNHQMIAVIEGDNSETPNVRVEILVDSSLTWAQASS
jgi:hypothetical protein